MGAIAPTAPIEMRALSSNKQDLFFKNTNETGQAETELENR